MTGNFFLDLAISVAGVIALVGLSAALGGWRSVPVTEARAVDRLSLDEPDFQPAFWRISLSGDAAAALSSDESEIAVVFRVGDRLASRRLKREAARMRADGALVVITLGEPSRRSVVLRAPDPAAAATWLSELSRPD